jgi:hypothetical protein
VIESDVKIGENSLCEDGDENSLINCSGEGMYALTFKMN